jgi:hypothetical protein
MRHVGNGVSRGFGFVLFARESEGEVAIKAMHGSRCGPNTLNVHRSVHDGTIVESNAVFVRNLPLDVTADRIAAFFSSVGVATSVTVAADTSKDAGDAPNGKRYKVGTVVFNDVETAREAVRKCHNRPFPVGNPLEEYPLVIVKFAESNELRRRKHANKLPLSRAAPQQFASSPTPPGSSSGQPSPGIAGGTPFVQHFASVSPAPPTGYSFEPIATMYGNHASPGMMGYPTPHLQQQWVPSMVGQPTYTPHIASAPQLPYAAQMAAPLQPNLLQGGYMYHPSMMTYANSAHGMMGSVPAPYGGMGGGGTLGIVPGYSPQQPTTPQHSLVQSVPPSSGGSHYVYIGAPHALHPVNLPSA